MFGFGKSKADKGLSIVIIGCGQVGKTLVEHLVNEGHEISVIDKNPDRIAQITNSCDVFGVVGNGASYSVQMEADIENADILIAVTDSDELNLLCCVVGKRVANCDVIARVRTPDYSKDAAYLKEELGLAMIINPDKEAADAISRILYMPTALEVIPFAKGLAELVRIKLPQGNILAGNRLMDLGKELAGALLIFAVERDGAVYIPDGRFELAAGDVISFVSPRRECKKALRGLGFHTHQVKDGIIVGGGRSAYYLAKQMVEHGLSTTIIETNAHRCAELSDLLPEAVIVNGDGTDEDLLVEAGLEHAESFIALTDIDEENIMLTLHAQSVSDAKIITKIHRMNFHNVINNMELGSVVYPQLITTEAIVKFVRAKKASMHSNIEAMSYMFNERVEVIEFLIEHESRITNKSLAELKLKKNILVTCIKRSGKIIIPNGSDCIRVGDSVIIATTHCGFSDILEILD